MNTTKKLEKTQVSPRVYVGTYAKYNDGNLNGGWISLLECKDYNDFLKKCKEFHKNERDPEYMIQDTSDMPDGLSCMDWLSESDFNDIVSTCNEDEEETEEEQEPSIQMIEYSEKAIAVVGDTRPIKEKLKELGGRFNPRLTCGPGWIFSKKKQNELYELLNTGLQQNHNTERTIDGEKWVSCLNEYIDKYGDPDYNKKRYCGAVKIGDYFYLIEKPDIENEFCFHDEGPDYEFYKTLMADERKLRDYFFEENISVFDKTIKYLKENGIVKINGKRDGRIRLDYMNDYWNQDKEVLNDKYKPEILAAYEFAKKQFEKRLNTYLNRYGVSKLHTWTYWADR